MTFDDIGYPEPVEHAEFPAGDYDAWRTTEPDDYDDREYKPGLRDRREEE